MCKHALFQKTKVHGVLPVSLAVNGKYFLIIFGSAISDRLGAGK